MKKILYLSAFTCLLLNVSGYATDNNNAAVAQSISYEESGHGINAAPTSNDMQDTDAMPTSADNYK